MKVACPHCSAAYNVDDRRVPAGGLNVRCPKCRQSFPVKTDAPSEGAPADAPVPLPAPAPPPLPQDRAAAGGSIPLPPPPAAAPPGSSPAVALPPPLAAPPAGAAGTSLAPPADPFVATPTEGGDVPLPPPEPFAPAPPAFGAAPAPVPDPFAGSERPTEAVPDPFSTIPEPFADPFDPLPVPAPTPPPERSPAAFVRPGAAGAFGAPPVPPPAAPPDLGFGEVDLSPSPPSPPPPSPPSPPAAAPAAAAAATPLPSTGDELEMLFGEGAAPKGKGGAGYKIRRRSGKIFGPFDEGQIVDMLAKGELMGNEDVAQEGGAWTPIGAVPAFGEALRKLTAEPATPADMGGGGAAGAREPQRLVPFGDRMAPARVADSVHERAARRRKRVALAAAALLVAGAGALGFVRYGDRIVGLVRRGDPARAGALSATARGAAAKGDYASERTALDLAAQAVAADPRSPDPAGLHAALAAGLAVRHAASEEAIAQLRAAADRLGQDEKGELGTLEAQLAAKLVESPGPATQAAESALEQAAQKRAPDAELLLLLARAALARGDGARADALFTRLAAIEPGVRALHGAGQAALARRDAAAAKAAFAKAVEKDPGHLPSRLELAALADAEGDVATADAQLAPVLAPGAETKLAPLERARALVLRARILSRSVAAAAQADAAFAAAVEADPRLVDARVAFAQHRLRRGDPTGAVAATDPVADQASRTPPLAAVRIRALALAGRALDASSLATAALQGAPGDLALLLAKAAALEASGKPEEAAALYRDAAGRDPAAFEPRLALGRIALGRKDLATAAGELAAAVEKAPREPAVQAALGELRAAQGDAAGAERAFQAALALDREHANAEIGLAKLASARGDVAGARARLERALAAEPRSVDGRVAYGTLLWRAKDLAGAEKAFQAAVDLAPRHALALARLGAVKLERGDAAGAVKFLTNASNEDERLVEARLWLGRALLAKGETTGAVAQLKKAVELDPGTAEHGLYLGDALDRSGAPQEAVEAYRAAAAADPRSADAHERIGALYAANGRCDEAVPALERAASLAPRVSRIRVALGDCKAKLGKNDEAARIFKDVLKGDPAAVQVLYRVARAVHESETPRAALPWYERAAKDDAQNPMPHYYLGYMYKEKNQRAKAVQEFKKYLALKPDAEEKRDIEAEIEDLAPARER